MTVITALRRQRQEDQRFEISLGYTEKTLCLGKEKGKRKGNERRKVKSVKGLSLVQHMRGPKFNGWGANQII